MRFGAFALLHYCRLGRVWFWSDSINPCKPRLLLGERVAFNSRIQDIMKLRTCDMKKKNKKAKRIAKQTQLKLRTGVKSGWDYGCYPTNEGPECEPGYHVDKGLHGYCCFPDG